MQPRRPPRIVQQHEREQAEYFRLVGQQGREDPGKADRRRESFANPV